MKGFLLYIMLIALTAELISGSGCANIVPPQGGPRDSIPPVVVKVTPGDSTRGFSANRIVFTFDEYIDVQNIQSQMVVSPSLPFTPDVNFRLNTLTVRFRDTLEANTTYSINFGDAVRDYTEGNPLRGLTYTFSTGPFIDSLELRGNVILAETGRIDTTLIVLLHTNPSDSAVMRERPRYIAKLNSRGEFIFRNLPPRTFYLYALKDETGSRRYTGDRQLFAFASDPVNMQEDPEPVTLYAYSTSPASGPTTAVPNINVGGRRTGQTTENRLRFQTNLQNEVQDLLSNLELKFESPLRNYDSTGLNLFTDSVFNPVSATRTLDSTRKRVVISTDWKENTAYHLILDRDFADDSLGKKLLKTDTVSFVTRKIADYGSVTLRFRGLDLTRRPVLQIVQNHVIYRSAPLTGGEFRETMFPPGEYELRILYDENGNGVWDPGVFPGARKQPEIVQAVERKITIRANWQNEIEIQL